jgi:hypothetical protein
MFRSKIKRLKRFQRKNIAVPAACQADSNIHFANWPTLKTSAVLKISYVAEMKRTLLMLKKIIDINKIIDIEREK